MFTYREMKEDDDVYYTIYDSHGAAFAEAWSVSSANLITSALNENIRRPKSLRDVMATLSPIEPGDKSKYQSDLNHLIELCRNSGEIKCSSDAKRVLLNFLAARLLAYETELKYSPGDTTSGIRILTAVCVNTRPGFVNGLSRHHKPENGLWSLDAQRLWVQLEHFRDEA